MNELSIAATPVTLGELAPLVEGQQDQISHLDEHLADPARQVTAPHSGGPGRAG